MTTTTEHGVRYDLDGQSFVRGGFTEAGARRVIAALTDAKPKDQRPTPAAVMVRSVGEWEPADVEDRPVTKETA